MRVVGRRVLYNYEAARSLGNTRTNTEWQDCRKAGAGVEYVLVGCRGCVIGSGALAKARPPGCEGGRHNRVVAEKTTIVVFLDCLRTSARPLCSRLRFCLFSFGEWHQAGLGVGPAGNLQGGPLAATPGALGALSEDI